MIKHVLKTLVAVLAIAFALPASAMQIYVHYDNGTWPTGISSTSFNTSGDLILEVEPSDSFENVKAKIEDKSGLNMNYMKLIFAGDECPDNQTLADRNIQKWSILHMIYTLPKHSVCFAEGTEDVEHWSIPDTVLSGSTLVATYNGDLKVKKVIATKHLGPLDTPLTLEALTNGTIKINSPQSGMKYTLNGGAKTAVTSGNININVAAGDKVAFYGNGTSITCYYGTTIAGGTADVKAYGNIMSLVDENGFATATTLTANDAFYYLFDGYAHLKDISGLVLPATTLSQSCYMGMFYNCTGLTTVPSDLLPATTMARGCYAGMFSDCENLTNVPTLPATTLAQYCYNNMFRACNGLTTVPTDLLPATTLAPSCYSYMFLNCSNLTTAPALPATTLAERCYMSMFANCTGLTTVPSDLLPATTLAEKCYQQMFYGCENLAASPVLPATTLVSYCYQQMFYDCSNLSSVTCLATSGINQDNSTEYWLERAGDVVQGTKTFNAVSTAEWPEDNSNGIPSGWTRHNIDN